MDDRRPPQRDAKSASPNSGVDIVWLVLCMILGAAIAFAVGALDSITSFGNGSWTRFVVVSLIAWPIATLVCYLAIKDLKQQWRARREGNRQIRSLDDPVVIMWVVALAIIGLLYRIFGTSP